MSAKYEHPASLVVWGLILARAAAAPLLSVYLSMARAIPVSSRDILYQAELITGMGVLRHVTQLANNPDATLSKLLSMYNAASTSSESDSKRLNNLILVAQAEEELSNGTVAISSPEPGPRPPTGDGSPAQMIEAPESEEDQGILVALERFSERSALVPQRPAAQATDSSGKRPYRSFPSEKAEEAAGFAVLDEAGWTDEGKPAMSKAEFRRVMNINNDRARALYKRWYYSRKPSPSTTTPLVEEEFAQ